MPIAGQSICCASASGQRVCGDITPPQCNGRALKIYNNQGVLVREVAARLTAEERARADAQARLEKQEQEAIREQRRKDQALLTTYRSLEDIDRAQKRREESIKATIESTRSLLEAAKKRKQELDAEVELYTSASNAVPPDLSKQQQNEEFEINAQTTLLTAKQKELDQIHKKFAEDRQRYSELTSKADSKRQD